MSAPTTPAAKKDKPLPCGHGPEHAKYLVGGTVLVCKTDEREWIWQPGHWKEALKKGPRKKLTVTVSSPST